MKICTYCGESKPLDKFSRDAKQTDGRQNWCKECYNGWRRDNIQSVKAKDDKWRAENREHVLAREAEYREKNLERRRAYAREYARKRREAAKRAA
ncbi:hypothetical protein ACFXMT_14140 [Streptomyces mirabilis]|uniref:hypothetical protein n=1 Tax=Streptomyces mirabilis TaxID=68239 RepID=UPI00369A6D4E